MLPAGHRRVVEIERTALDGEGIIDRDSAQGLNRAQAGGFDAGQRFYSADKLLKKSRDLRRLRVSSFRQIDSDAQQFAGVHDRIDALQPNEAIEHQARAYQQRHSNRHFADDQQIPQPVTSARRGGGAFLQPMLQPWPRSLQRRRKSEDQAGQDGERESEKQDAPVDIDLLQARQIVGAERDERLDSQPRQAQTAGAAQRSDQQTFGQ